MLSSNSSGNFATAMEQGCKQRMGRALRLKALVLLEGHPTSRLYKTSTNVSADASQSIGHSTATSADGANGKAD